MSPLKINQERISYSEGDKHISDYLEKKYGKEPKLSVDELEELRWNWH